MNLAWLHDQGNTDGSRGGAELTMDEFAAAAPDEVEFTDLKAAETVVIGNCVTIDPGIIPGLIDRRVIRYRHDLARHEAPVLRSWLDENAEHIFTSPLHRETYGLDGAVIPPAVDLSRFRPNRQTRRNTERKGTCTVGSWQNPGKGGDLISELAARRQEPIDVWGFGPYLPCGEFINQCGSVDQIKLPELLAAYETFVFLPTAIEPFGRCVVEAWAAECSVICNELVGAKWWIENHPDKLSTAGDDFWRVVIGE